MFIPLTRGKTAVVDDEDAPLVAAFRWHASCVRLTWYAARWDGKTKRNISMHRAIFNAQSGEEVDHRDGDGLNNRRENLRIATKSQNRWNMQRLTRNKSGLRGVYFDKSQNRWRAKITHNDKAIYLGSFRNKESAAVAYKEASERLFGEFAGPLLAERGGKR